MKKAEMMNKMELDIMAMENVSGGTGPLTKTGPLTETGPLGYETGPLNGTGPLASCDPPKGTGPLGNAVGPVKDWRR